MARNRGGDMAAPTHVERLSREKWSELQKYNKEQSAKNAYGKGTIIAGIL